MTQVSPTSPDLLSREAMRGTFWSYLAFASGKLLNFITTMILARLLVPEQFGLIGYCTIAIQYLDIMNTAGIDNALVSRREKLTEATNAAFVINILMGMMSFGAAWLIAPLIANYFQAEQVTGLFRLLAIILPISGLGLVPSALLQRGLHFRARLILDVSRNISKGLTSILLALLGWGPWSLVWGQITGESIAVFLAWTLSDWRPGWKFDWPVTKKLMGYGGHILIGGFAGALHQNVDYIIVGKILGDAALGLYTMAYRIPELAIQSLNGVAGNVLFPILSRTQSDVEAMRTFYFGYIRYISLFTFSIGTGLALTSGLFVKNFMSNQWEPAILPMALISLALAISSVGHAPGILYKALNRPEILTRVTFGRLPIIIAILLLCSRWGITGVAIGQIVVAIFSISLDSYLVSRIIHFKFSELTDALAPAAISSAIMAGVLGFIEIIFAPAGWAGFGILVIVGVIAFIIALSLISRETAAQIVVMLRKEVIGKWLPRSA